MSLHHAPALSYQVGQNVRHSLVSQKVTPKFIGPFTIKTIANPIALRLRLPRSMHIHHTFHIGSLKAVHESPLVLAPVPPPSFPHWRWSSLLGQMSSKFTSSRDRASVPSALGGVWARGEVPDSALHIFNSARIADFATSWPGHRGAY